MLQNEPNCTINFFFREAYPRTPLVNASQAPPPPNNSCPPLANPAYAHELLLLKNLFEKPPWQAVGCVYSNQYVISRWPLKNLVRYMSMHYKIFLGGKKMTKIVAQHILKYITWALFSNTMCP